MASFMVRSINCGVVFIGIFAVCSFAVARKPQTKMTGAHQRDFGAPNPTMAVTTTTVKMSPNATAAVGQIFSFDKDASPATIFGHVLIPCALFAVLAVTLYGGLRGTQYLFTGLKKKVQAGRHQTSYKDMRESGYDQDVVMETGGEVV